MKAAIFRAGKIGGTLVLAFILAGCRHPAPSSSASDAALKGVDVAGGGRLRKGGGRRKRGRKRSRRVLGDQVTPGDQTAPGGGATLDGQVTEDALDEETLCGIGRGRSCDIQVAVKRGLFETGLEPAFPKGFDCLGIDEAWAIDYTYKRDRENYHGGIDMPTSYGTPIIAAADGTVVGKYEGRRTMRGREIIIRHSPGDTGLPVWTYTQYAHFDEMPKREVGERVRMGEILGPTGNSGKQGRRERRPAIHYAVWFSADPRYVPRRRKIIPVGGFWMDPIALYRGGPPFDSKSMKALPEGGKRVPVSVMTKDGKVIPPGAKVVWPYFCERK